MTTGSQPGSFTFQTPNTDTFGLITTPVSTVDTKMTGNIADALKDLPNLPAGETLTSYNPMSVAMQAAQMLRQMVQTYYLEIHRKLRIIRRRLKLTLLELNCKPLLLAWKFLLVVLKVLIQVIHM